MYFIVFQTTERIVSFYVIVKRNCAIQHLDVTLCDDKFMFNQIFIKQYVWITNLHVIIVCLYKIIIYAFIFPAFKLNIRVVKCFCFVFLVSPISTIVIPTTTTDFHFSEFFSTTNGVILPINHPCFVWKYHCYCSDYQCLFPRQHIIRRCRFGLWLSAIQIKF